MSLLPNLTAPLLGNSKPAIMRKSVVFPHPLGPKKEKSSPLLITKFTLSTALKLPKSLLRFSSMMSSKFVLSVVLVFSGSSSPGLAHSPSGYILPQPAPAPLYPEHSNSGKKPETSRD